MKSRSDWLTMVLCLAGITFPFVYLSTRLRDEFLFVVCWWMAFPYMLMFWMVISFRRHADSVRIVFVGTATMMIPKAMLWLWSMRDETGFDTALTAILLIPPCQIAWCFLTYFVAYYYATRLEPQRSIRT